jgi:hypothetical protein
LDAVIARIANITQIVHTSQGRRVGELAFVLAVFADTAEKLTRFTIEHLNVAAHDIRSPEQVALDSNLRKEEEKRRREMKNRGRER